MTLQLGRIIVEDAGFEPWTSRAVDPHSFLFYRIRIELFLNADPDPPAFLMRIQIQL